MESILCNRIVFILRAEEARRAREAKTRTEGISVADLTSVHDAGTFPEIELRTVSAGAITTHESRSIDWEKR